MLAATAAGLCREDSVLPQGLRIKSGYLIGSQMSATHVERIRTGGSPTSGCAYQSVAVDYRGKEQIEYDVMTRIAFAGERSMRFPGLRIVFRVLAGLLWCACVAGAAPGAPDGVVLFDFETDAEVSAWSVRDLTELSGTSEWASHGTRAASITYRTWSEGREQWPAVIAPANALATRDFSPFRYLLWEAHNPGKQAVRFKLHLRDASAKRFSREFTVPAKSTESLRVPIASLGVDSGDISELHFYVTRPERTFTVFVDHIRLSYGLMEDLRDLCSRAITLESDLNRAWQDVGGIVPAVLQQQVERAGVLRRQCDALLQAATEGAARTPDRIASIRNTIAALSAEADRLAGLRTCLRAAKYASRHGQGDFLLTPVSSMRKVFLQASRFDQPFADCVTLAAARNEHEHAQVVIVPFGGDLSGVTWSLETLKGPGGATVPARVRLVGYVNCEQPSYQVAATGWWPDPLLSMVPTVDRIAIGDVQPLWLSVAVPADAPAGLYTGALTVQAQGLSSERIPIDLTVWDFGLPEAPPLRTALSFRGLSSKLYAPERIPALENVYEEWMLEQYWLNPGNIYSGGPPAWSAERLSFLVKHGLNAINLGYFNAPRGAAFNADSYWKRFDELVDRVKAYMPVVEAAGARDLCYFYCFDERPKDQLDVVFETARLLKQMWPDIEVMTTAYDETFGLERKNGDVIDIWVPLTPKFDTNAERIAEARKRGRDIWWYICIGPKNPYANWFVEYTAIEPRLIMGAMTAKYRPGGFLYYAVNRWPLNDGPITTGPRTDWNPASYKNNNGDGSIMCAGPDGPLATIRLENIRDGLEDLAYYQRVRELHREHSGILSRSVDVLTWPLRVLGAPVGPRHSGAVSSRVVADLSHFTLDPAVVEAERRRLAEEILRLGD
jgi:hypothetical protein